MRSWCNPSGEDSPDTARFNLQIFEASAQAFLAHAPPLSQRELTSLAPGVERICLELAARFCADAVTTPTYFREDRKRFPMMGNHNLHRARCQFQLGRSARAQRTACEQIIRQSAASSDSAGR